MQQVRSGACNMGPVDGGHNLEDGKDTTGKDLSHKSNYSAQGAPGEGIQNTNHTIKETEWKPQTYLFLLLHSTWEGATAEKKVCHRNLEVTLWDSAIAFWDVQTLGVFLQDVIIHQLRRLTGKLQAVSKPLPWKMPELKAKILTWKKRMRIYHKQADVQVML